MGVSQHVIAVLGGATQQAVSKSGSPRKWLDARIRQALLPMNESPSGYIQVDRASLVKERAQALMRAVVTRVSGLVTPLGGGRPALRDPRELAEFLGVPYEAGASLIQVFRCYLLEKIRTLKPLLGQGKFWSDFWRVLDQQWLPYWVRWQPVYEELIL